MKLFLILLLLAGFAYSGELTVTVPFDGSSVTMRDYAGYTVLYSPETYPIATPGVPALPVLPLQVALPPESRAVSVTVVDAAYIPVRGRFDILPATEQVPLSLMDITDIPLPSPDPGIYNSSETFPQVTAVFESSGSLLGFPVARISVYPVRWNPASGQLETLDSVTLTVEYVPDPSARTVQVRSVGSEQRSGDLVRNLVINPEGVFSSGAVMVESRDLTFGEYVIITHPDYVSQAGTLAEWKTRKGVPATVVTTTWVNSNYSGVDLQQRIRRFLHDAMDNGVDYALIFGDDDKVAARRIRISYSSYSENAPGDYYWADLNDNAYGGVDQWDSNGNGIWGQYNIDNVSYYPAMLTGRASVNSVTEANTFVNKVLLYEQVDSPTTGPVELRIGYSTEQLWPGCWGSVGAEIIANNYVPSGWSHDKRYQSQGTNSWAATNAMFNGLQHHIYVAAHGSQTSFSVPGGSYSNSNLLNLNNISSGGLPAIWNSISCLIGHLDSYECMLDAWTANPNGGGFGAANARYGWGSPSSPGNGASEVLCQRIYQAHFVNGQNTLGAMHFMGRYTLCPPTSSVMHWCIMNYNLFGCPELPLWTVSPAQLDVAFPLSYSGGSFTVVVTADGSPVSGARVTLYKGDSFQDADVYLVATTNSSGEVVFHPEPSTIGEMRVTAWKYNHIAALGSTTVTGTSTEGRAEGIVSVVTGVGSPHPSPAVSMASIPLSLDAASQVSLQVYDLSGRLVTTLLQGDMPAGVHNIAWDLTTASGVPVPNGSYRIRATAGDYIGTTSLMVLR
jgi:hypothetical protein